MGENRRRPGDPGGTRRGTEPRSERELRLARHFAAHDGVISRAEAAGLGFDSAAVNRRRKSGHWVTLGPGTYLSAAHTLTDAARARAAVRLTGGVLDGPAAAWWHGLTDECPSTLGVSHPHRRGAPRALFPIEVHTRRLLPADLALEHAVPVTARPLTVLDACTSLGSTFVDRALQTDAVSLRALELAVERNSGRWGMARARALLRIASDDAESEAERRFIGLLRLHGITRWIAQMPFGPYRIDVAFPEAALAVEIDGWAFHRTRERATADARKANRLTLHRWRLLRYGWHALDADPEGVIDEVVAALAAPV